MYRDQLTSFQTLMFKSLAHQSITNGVPSCLLIDLQLFALLHFSCQVRLQEPMFYKNIT